jgi:PleD family two-component response regulator
LILLDVFMEPHDGLQVLKDLKLDLKYSSIPVVMYSGDDNVELLHLCIREGAREYITKPLHPIYKDVLLKHVSAQTRYTCTFKGTNDLALSC